MKGYRCERIWFKRTLQPISTSEVDCNGLREFISNNVEKLWLRTSGKIIGVKIKKKFRINNPLLRNPPVTGGFLSYIYNYKIQSLDPPSSRTTNPAVFMLLSTLTPFARTHELNIQIHKGGAIEIGATPFPVEWKGGFHSLTTKWSIFLFLY